MTEPLAERGRKAQHALAWAVLAAILLAAFWARFADLTDRPFAHDESLFAYYSYCVYPWGIYRYDPLLHGPLLEHLTGGLYAVAGDSDFTARFWPAFLGSLAVGLIWGFRRRIGIAGALGAAALACSSPTLLFYSRFLRNDIPLFFFSLLLVLSFDRWLRKDRDAWGAFFVCLFAGLMVCVKENAVFVFFTGATYFIWAFVVDEAAGRLTRARTGGRLWRSQLLLDPTEILRSIKISIANCLVWIGFVFVARQLVPKLFPPPLYSTVSGLLAAAVLFSNLLLAAVVRSRYSGIGRDGLGRVFVKRFAATWVALGSGALIALALYAALFTTLFRFQWGFFQIYRETLAYWWGQHAENRLKGPFHYYAPRLLVYETAALAVACAGALASIARRRRLAGTVIAGEAAIAVIVTAALHWFPFDEAWMDQHAHVSHPWHIYFGLGLAWLAVCLSTQAIRSGRVFHGWLVWWTVFGFLEYSYAGEKVPWIGVHIAGPLVLLAGAEIGRFAAWLKDRSVPLWARRAAALACGGCVAVLFARQIDVAYEVCFLRGADSGEMLVYNHTMPETAELARQIEAYATRTGVGYDLGITVEHDCDATWPLIWYLRRYPRFNNPQPLATTSDRIVIASANGISGAARDFVEYNRRTIGLRQAWVPEELDLRAMFECALAKAGVKPRETDAEAQKRFEKEIDKGAGEWRRAWRYFSKREPWLRPDETTIGVPVTYVFMQMRETIRRQMESRPVTPIMPLSAPAQSLLTPVDEKME